MREVDGAGWGGPEYGFWVGSWGMLLDHPAGGLISGGGTELRGQFRPAPVRCQGAVKPCSTAHLVLRIKPRRTTPTRPGPPVVSRSTPKSYGPPSAALLGCEPVSLGRLAVAVLHP